MSDPQSSLSRSATSPTSSAPHLDISISSLKQRRQIADTHHTLTHYRGLSAPPMIRSSPLNPLVTKSGPQPAATSTCIPKNQTYCPKTSPVPSTESPLGPPPNIPLPSTPSTSHAVPFSTSIPKLKNLPPTPEYPHVLDRGEADKVHGCIDSPPEIDRLAEQGEIILQTPPDQLFNPKNDTFLRPPTPDEPLMEARTIIMTPWTPPNVASPPSPPFRDYDTPPSTHSPAQDLLPSENTRMMRLQRRNSSDSDDTVMPLTTCTTSTSNSSRVPSPPSPDGVSPDLVTPHLEGSQFTPALSWKTDNDYPDEGLEADLLVLRWEVERLKLERDKATADARSLTTAVHALNEHADHLVVTIDINSLSSSLVELCGVFPRAGPHGIPFLNSLESLAQIVGSRAPNFKDLYKDPAMMEIMTRTCHVLLDLFDPNMDKDVSYDSVSIGEVTPPDELWLFVQTADEVLLRPLKKVLQIMLDTCEGSSRSVVIRLLLHEITENHLRDRKEDEMRYKWWAMKQRLKFEKGGWTLERPAGVDGDGGKFCEDDLRRVTWAEVKRFLPRTAEEEWEEAY